MAGRLASVLRVRRVQERQALAEVARAEAEVREAEARAEQATRTRLAWAVPHGVTLDAVRLRTCQLEALALHDAEAAALAETVAASHRRDRAREGWTSARSALRSVERLDEHRQAVRAATAAAQAQAAADELALLRRGDDDR